MEKRYGKQEIRDLLEERQIPYAWMDHPAVFTMEEMEAAGITRRGPVCKNLFLRDAKGKNQFLVVLPEEKRADLSALAGQINSTKLSFASAERLEKYLGVAQGSVSPLGVLNDEAHQVTVIFDRDLAQSTGLGIHPNDNTATIWISFQDLEDLIRGAGNPVQRADFQKA